MASPITNPRVIIAFDATKVGGEEEVSVAINRVLMRGDILHAGDTLVLLGILHRVRHPMGYRLKACPDAFVGTSARTIEDEVSRKVHVFTRSLHQSAHECEDKGVKIEVKITAGYPIKQVVLQEVTDCNASWVVLDRHVGRELKFYDSQLPSKIALIQDGLSVEIWRGHAVKRADSIIPHKPFYSVSKPVPVLDSWSSEDKEEAVSLSLSPRSPEGCESLTREHATHPFASHSVDEQSKRVFHHTPSDSTNLCSACIKSAEFLNKSTLRLKDSDVQLATIDFSKENLVGEGRYGMVFKGKLENGRAIAAKVLKEEFDSNIFTLGFPRHKNIVMLLGYCCKDKATVLVHEYVCNRSLDWHLFHTETVLEWQYRHAIAIGAAKGLRFLHEECRRGPIIHGSIQPSNIMLTHEFVPMISDFGLAKGDSSQHVSTAGAVGYLAPECAEKSTLTLQTDVYAFGIVLLQLISGRKVVGVEQEEEQLSLPHWAEPLIQKPALHELIDPRLGDSYATYNLSLIAKTAFLCLQRTPENRPSMGEVVRLLEGDTAHFNGMVEHFVPRYAN